MDYIRMTRLIEERRVRRFMLNGGRNGHKRVGKAVDPLIERVRKSTTDATSAVTRLMKSIEDALR